MNILVIEDELLIQKSLQKLLQRRGANVEVVATGIDAIKLIQNNDFDRIICDLMLQDITGFDVIEEVKKKYGIEQLKDIVTIITAYSSEQVLKKAEAYNCTLLHKPFSDINSAIDIFLKNKDIND